MILSSTEKLDPLNKMSKLDIFPFEFCDALLKNNKCPLVSWLVNHRQTASQMNMREPDPLIP